MHTRMVKNLDTIYSKVNLSVCLFSLYWQYLRWYLFNVLITYISIVKRKAQKRSFKEANAMGKV